MKTRFHPLALLAGFAVGSVMSGCAAGGEGGGDGDDGVRERRGASTAAPVDGGASDGGAGGGTLPFAPHADAAPNAHEAGPGAEGGAGPMFQPTDSHCKGTGPNADLDHDGFTPATGDCDECSDQINPAAYDIPGNGIDEDCNGVADDEPATCDTGLGVNNGDPLAAARALDLCKEQHGDSWGVVDAAWVAVDGSSGMNAPNCDDQESVPNPQQYGLLGSFGLNVEPRSGVRMLALSSGIARAGKNGASPAGASMCGLSETPPGFPQDSPSCSTSTADDHTARDPVALELTLRVPSNAKGFAFDFDFYTYEWPKYVCTQYNDFFVALLSSHHDKTPSNKNISFDSKGNPMSVNSGFVEVCKGPADAGGKSFPCKLGTSELAGTGFEGHAATSWLTTEASVMPGETIRLRFALWDMGDDQYDSTVLLDHFRWETRESAAPTTKPVHPR